MSYVFLFITRCNLAGGTQEYDAMVKAIREAHPVSKLVGVGFSMGGNVLCKYLGENPANEKQFVCAISVCQGYSAAKCVFNSHLCWQLDRQRSAILQVS